MGRTEYSPVLGDDEIEMFIHLRKDFAQLREDPASYEDYLRSALTNSVDRGEHLASGAPMRGECAVKVDGDGVEIRGQGNSWATAQRGSCLAKGSALTEECSSLAQCKAHTRPSTKPGSSIASSEVETSKDAGRANLIPR